MSSPSALTFPSSTSTIERMPSLDSLRGVAILMVIFGHFLPLRLSFGQAAYHVTSLGRGGVLLFFLLSGYLVFRNVESQSTVTFLSRRLFKIFPAYWVNLMLIFALGLFGSHEGPLTSDVFFSNFFMVQDVFHRDSLSGVYWTLLIEVKFYLFLSLQYLLLRDRGVLLVLACLVAINLAVWLMRGHASLLLTFFPAFYVGIRIRQAESAGWTHLAMISAGCVSLLVAASLLVFDDQYGLWSAAYVICESAGLVVFMRANISNATLNFFGRISYSHYLYHTAVGYAFLSLMPLVTTWTVNLLVIAAATALTTAVAFVSYRLVEVPMVNFGKAHERFWISLARRRLQQAP
jgi:peptidoglycan/LPS O-acetylase OafA/YrhL